MWLWMTFKVIVCSLSLLSCFWGGKWKTVLWYFSPSIHYMPICKYILFLYCLKCIWMLELKEISGIIWLFLVNLAVTMLHVIKQGIYLCRPQSLYVDIILNELHQLLSSTVRSNKVQLPILSCKQILKSYNCVSFWHCHDVRIILLWICLVGWQGNREHDGHLMESFHGNRLFYIVLNWGPEGPIISEEYHSSLR